MNQPALLVVVRRESAGLSGGGVSHSNAQHTLIKYSLAGSAGTGLESHPLRRSRQGTSLDNLVRPYLNQN